MKNEDESTLNLLPQLFKYDPKTGHIFWRKKTPDMFPDTGRGGAKANAARWNARYAGKRAFNTPDFSNHLIGRIGTTPFRAHRVAWAMHYGEWPKRYIDHIDGNPENNRIENLRDVSHRENMRNRSIQSNNKSGKTGVCWNSGAGAWLATIRNGKKMVFLGHFDKFREAVIAREAAERALGFSERHGK